MDQKIIDPNNTKITKRSNNIIYSYGLKNMQQTIEQ